MRRVALLIVFVAAIATGSLLRGGRAAASHRAASAVVRDAVSPSWSPDGKQIVFMYVWLAPTSCCGLQPSRYRIVRTSSSPGGAVRTIHAGKTYVLSNPMAWAAGGHILFEDSTPANGLLKSVGVGGGRPKPIPASSNCACGPDQFILSPNREVAAVTLRDGDPHIPDGIALMRLKPGRDPVVIATPLTAEEQGKTPISDEILALSPDGRQLVFSRAPWDPWEGDTAPPVLMAIHIGGGEPVPLTQSGIPGANHVPTAVQQLQWSPDGRWVAFVENQNLEVVPTNGGATRVLATDFGSCASPGGGFSWSPTSQVIAYDNCPNQGNPRLMTIRPDGTHPTDPLQGRRLTFLSTYQSRPQWSPDGSRLLFTAQRLSHRTIHVWAIKANGHDLIKLG